MSKVEVKLAMLLAVYVSNHVVIPIWIAKVIPATFTTQDTSALLFLFPNPALNILAMAAIPQMTLESDCNIDLSGTIAASHPRHVFVGYTG